MKILVVNCGSSSLKYQLIDSATEEVSASGQCERIGLDGIFSIKVNGKKIEKEVDIPNHSVGMKTVLDALVDPEHAVLKSLDEIEAIGHRVVHGGEKFSSSVLIDEEVIREIDECSALAPLHNPANILGIRACQKIMPGVPNVQCLIRHSIRPCRQRHIYMVFQRSIMRNTESVVTVSMEQAMRLFPRDWLSLQDSTSTILR